MTLQTGPLSGVRVLDFTRVLAGPFATMLLADLGADVVKIERPDGGDDTRQFGPPFLSGESTYFLSINRGKRSITVDLKSEHGQAVIRALAHQSDVLVENFRPGVLNRLGFGYEALKELNPRLIYASISGFGHDGLPEYSQAPGYDLMIQALSGVASLTGAADGPPSKAGVSIGDLVGGLYAVHGILAALFEREKSGHGHCIDISMFDGLVSLLTYQAGSYFATGKVPTRMGNRHPSICPFETMECADGHLAICCGTDAQFQRLCAALGCAALAEDTRFQQNADRVQHREELTSLLQDIFREQSMAHWMELLANQVPCAPIQSVDKVLSHPQLDARGMLAEIEHPKAGTLQAVGCPVRIDGQPSLNKRPPPLLGQHTRELLDQLGLQADEDLE
jgi:crotonobetainyl-CoA:carnitine CoA-transferase CaiB-like acyl-CoA transferase